MKQCWRTGVALAIGLGLAACAHVPGKQAAAGNSQAVVTRLFFQDYQTKTVLWADVKEDEQQKLVLSPVTPVPGLKKLDATKQNLVQMAESKGLILVGVRDNAAGGYENGWYLLHCGVSNDDHGDHGHWQYKSAPEVWDTRLDDQQGNPAHVYVYGEVFYLANDRLNGYTRIDPRQYRKGKDGRKTLGTPGFLKGGGNHITLAAAGDKVGYACWIDGEGPQQGQVDVTAIQETGNAQVAYSFHLPTGGIHGAIANQNKVFFAPASGVCWVEADLELRRQPPEVQVHHVDLGQDGDRPRRTGAFVNQGPYVVCVTGRDESTALVLLDAGATQLTPLTVAIPVQKGTRATTPHVVQTAAGDVYAFVFHDHHKTVQLPDALSIVNLDPNRDGNYRDAEVCKTLPVGNSAVEGHSGHHDMAFDADHRLAFFTNPGDGTITVFSLRDLAPVTEFTVGGTPTHLVACGGKETFD
jgi:hypothetical protein